jgi:hypothetical protein
MVISVAFPDSTTTLELMVYEPGQSDTKLSRQGKTPNW